MDMPAHLAAESKDFHMENENLTEARTSLKSREHVNVLSSQSIFYGQQLAQKGQRISHAPC